MGTDHQAGWQHVGRHPKSDKLSDPRWALKSGRMPDARWRQECRPSEWEDTGDYEDDDDEDEGDCRRASRPRSDLPRARR